MQHIGFLKVDCPLTVLMFIIHPFVWFPVSTVKMHLLFYSSVRTPHAVATSCCFRTMRSFCLFRLSILMPV